MQAGYSQVKFAQLSSGTKIPRVGYGTSQADNLDTLLVEAINIGYRHIDTAACYYNEELVGKAITTVLKEGKVKREDLFVTTKVFAEMNDCAKSLNKSLKDLNVDYVDLLLIHWPVADWDKETQTFKRPPLHVIWKQLEDLVRSGKTKAIGVSNFNVQILVDLLTYAEIKPVCNQIEVHPYLIQEDLIAFCKKNGIEITAYSPLGGNFPGGSFGQELSVKTLVAETAVKELAEKYNKTPTQIVLNWHLSRGYVVIPKTSTISRLRENLECDTFEMTVEELKRITALNRNARACDPKNWEGYGFTPVFA